MELKEGVVTAVKDKLASADENGIFYANPKAPMIAQAIKAGAIECNESMAGEVSGQFATRLTEAGKAFFNATEAVPATVTTNPATNGSTDNMDTPATSGMIAGYAAATIAPPTTKKKGKWTEVFENLADGQSVFVPATDDMPKPKDTLASTITGQNKRELDAATAAGTKAKYFVTFAIDNGEAYGEQFKGKAGAAIFRLDDRRKSK